jgi:hypothetical protein
MKHQIAVLAAAFILAPSLAFAQCGGDTCSVGGAGTGGVNSDGKAQGFRLEEPSTNFPGGTLTNSGNNDAGRLHVTDALNPVGSLSGTFRENPQPAARGHGTGIFGDWSGQCEEDFSFDDC